MKRFFLFITLFLFACLSFAQERNFRLVKQPTENSVANQKRKAVVIGMSDYGNDRNLDNTINDANDMADALTKLGFEVTLLKNNDLRNLRINLTNWYNSIDGNDMAVFYFSGHGMEVGGENYLIPVGAELASQADVPDYTLSVNNVLRNMDEKRVGMKLLILDACRDNPFTRSWSRGSGEKGLAQMDAPEGTFIAFAAAPGRTAADGGTYNLRNGVFTYCLIQEILKPGLTIDGIFNRVTGDVAKLTNKEQTPFKNSSLGDDFYFIPGTPNDNPVPYNPTPAPTPNNLPAPVNTQRHPAEPDLVLVQGGTFWMGCSNEQESDCYPDESPLHSVTLSNFYIGKYEVTQKQWQLIMGSNPSNFKGDNLPVEQVSWNDVQEFISRLNAATGKQYRLPTEAEWEYAARGGSKSQGYKYGGSNNPNDVAWFSDNSGNTTHPVGTKWPNELGIYDMSGNVSEWCNDWHDDYSSSPQRDPMGASSGFSRVNRGGSWNLDERFVCVWLRLAHMPDCRVNFLGFRLACNSN